MYVTKTEKNGYEIAIVRYSQCKTKEDMLEALEEIVQYIKQSQGKVRFLDDFEGAFGSRDYMAKAKEYGEFIEGHTDKSAIIGIHGVKKVLLKAYNVVTNSKIKPFDTEEEALEYLGK